MKNTTKMYIAIILTAIFSFIGFAFYKTNFAICILFLVSALVPALVANMYSKIIEDEMNE